MFASIAMAESFKITIKGSSFDCPADSYILDAAETAGIDLPFSCKAGAW